MGAVTVKQAITTWADRWRMLKAWGRELDAASWKVTVRERHLGAYSTGYCHYNGHVVITATAKDMVDSLSTILHEFAHAAVPRRADQPRVHHDVPWQRIYAAAVFEVTAASIPNGVEDYKLMDTAANIAIKQWWRRSGNEFAWQLVAKKG